MFLDALGQVRALVVRVTLAIRRLVAALGVPVIRALLELVRAARLEARRPEAYPSGTLCGTRVSAPGG